MVFGSWIPIRENYIEEIARFCNEQSIWVEDGKDHLMLYHPCRQYKDKMIAYLKSKGMMCGSLFYTGIWFYLNENSGIFDYEKNFQEMLDLRYG